MDQIVYDHLKLGVSKADMSEWSAMVDKIMNLKKPTRIVLVGKYVELPDAYLSAVEAPKHSGYVNDTAIDLKQVNTNDLIADSVEEVLGDADGIIVPGGFGQRGTEGKIEAIRYACERGAPILGICLNIQLTCVEFVRNVLNLEGVNSARLDPDTKYPIIDTMHDQVDIEDMGGTLRLGLYPCKLKPSPRTAQAYNSQEIIQRRHRHHYGSNTKFRDQFEEAGFVFSDVSPDGHLMEVVGLPKEEFFVAAQYHPELQSHSSRPEELCTAFVTAAIESSK